MSETDLRSLLSVGLKPGVKLEVNGEGHKKEEDNKEERKEAVPAVVPAQKEKSVVKQEEHG